MILVDTNVVSEFMRDRVDLAVAQWAESVPSRQLVMSVITIEEIEFGIGKLPSGVRRDRLRRAWQEVLSGFEESVITYDTAAAVATAEMLVRSLRSGSPMSLADAQIAGICLANGFALATRNVKDFQGRGDLHLINPFSD